MRQHGDTQIPHCDDVRRGCSRTRSALRAAQDINERLVVVRDHDANAKGAENEEESVSPVDCLERIFDVDARASGFTGNHGDVLGAYHAERCSPESTEKALKSAETAGSDIFGKSAWIAPIAESISVMFGITSHHRDEGEKEQHEDQND